MTMGVPGWFGWLHGLGNVLLGLLVWVGEGRVARWTEQVGIVIIILGCRQQTWIQEGRVRVESVVFFCAIILQAGCGNRVGILGCSLEILQRPWLT